MSTTLPYNATIRTVDAPKKALRDSDVRLLIDTATRYLNHEIDDFRVERAGGRGLKIIPLKRLR